MGETFLDLLGKTIFGILGSGDLRCNLTQVG